MPCNLHYCVKYRESITFLLPYLKLHSYEKFSEVLMNAEKLFRLISRSVKIRSSKRARNGKRFVLLQEMLKMLFSHFLILI